MELLNNLSDLATIASLFVGGGALLVGVRVGPIRALTLGFKSRFHSVNPNRKSVRTSQIKQLRQLLNATEGESYVVVQGPKGVGKSCMIDTCLANTKGVIYVTVTPGTLQESITNNCLNKLAGGLAFRIIDQKPNVLRVLFWYRIFFRDSPTLVLSMSERPTETKPAQVTGAVRELAAMGLKVLVDASPNSLPPELLTTTRESVLYVDGLSNDEIRSLPQLHQMFRILDAASLSDLVLDMLDGVPSVFMKLAKELLCDAKSDPYEVVNQFLCMKVKYAITQIQIAVIQEPKLSQIFVQLKSKNFVETDLLVDLRITLPSPCKVLRTRNLSDLVPYDSLTALAFRYNCNRTEAVQAINELINAARLSEKS